MSPDSFSWASLTLPRSPFKSSFELCQCTLLTHEQRSSSFSEKGECHLTSEGLGTSRPSLYWKTHNCGSDISYALIDRFVCFFQCPCLQLEVERKKSPVYQISLPAILRPWSLFWLSLDYMLQLYCHPCGKAVMDNSLRDWNSFWLKNTTAHSGPWVSMGHT